MSPLRGKAEPGSKAVMETTLFFGHALAGAVDARTRSLIAGLGRAPRCTVLLNPDDPAMMAYARRQRAAAEALGIALTFEPYAPDAERVQQQLSRLSEDPAVDAAVTLYPLPAGLDPVVVARRIGAEKDVDGLHPLNTGLTALGDHAAAPATARACLLVATALAPALKGAEVVIVGASRIVGRPLAQLLLDAEATVTLCHAATRDLTSHIRQADVVVSAAGVPGLIGADDIRAGAVLIDVAVTRQGDGLVGDIDLASVQGKAAVVTHVPDGVGPVTTACLFENVARAAAART